MNDKPKTEKLDTWAIIEILGHRKLAGRISEQNVAGCPMLRVDIPEVEGVAAFTQFYSNHAIYSITPTTEEVARAFAEQLRERPVQQYELKMPQLQAHTESHDLDDDDFDDADDDLIDDDYDWQTNIDLEEMLGEHIEKIILRKLQQASYTVGEIADNHCPEGIIKTTWRSWVRAKIKALEEKGLVKKLPNSEIHLYFLAKNYDAEIKAIDQEGAIRDLANLPIAKADVGDSTSLKEAMEKLTEASEEEAKETPEGEETEG